MTTRTKANLTSGVTGGMMLLNAFSVPLHIVGALKLALLIGMFLPLALLFHYIKQLKQETPPPPTEVDAAERRRKTKRALIVMLVAVAAVSLSTPYWAPLAGTNLGPRRDFICGLTTMAVFGVILGYRWRKI